jgi:hypothetical protein
LNTYLEGELGKLNVKHLFSHSGLQVVDVFANSVFKKYEHNNSELFDIIKERTTIIGYFFNNK